MITVENREIKDPVIECKFSYGVQQLEQNKVYDEIRLATKELAYLLDEKVPWCREKELAMNELEKVVFWVHRAIAYNEMAVPF